MNVTCEAMAAVRQTRLSVLLCPSDPKAGTMSENRTMPVAGCRSTWGGVWEPQSTHWHGRYANHTPSNKPHGDRSAGLSEAGQTGTDRYRPTSPTSG